MASPNFDPNYLAKALAEAAARENAANSLAGYSQYMLEFLPARHHKLICEKLDNVINGVIDPNHPKAIKRLIIAAPPGSAKSTYTSLAFAAYAAGKLPRKSNIVAASHTDEFSQTWGRRVRNLISDPRQAKIFPHGIVAPDDRAASRWSTVGGTEYFGVGVGGSVTGRRADILLCDDLLRGRVDADSKKKRDEIWGWFTADAYTRLKNNAAIVVIATRWHEDDLTGRLLERMEAGGEHWEFLKLQALNEDEDDPMRRPIGAALWPENQPEEMMVNIRDNSGMSARDWASLYQQNPSPEDGNMISRKWFNRYNQKNLMDTLRSECEIVISNDTAMKGAERNDPTVTLAFARHKNGSIYLLREQRIKEEFVGMKKNVRSFIFEIAEEFNCRPTVLIENKGNGSALASSLKTEISFPIIEMEPKQLGDKEFRFDRCTPIFEAGQFHVPNDSEHSVWTDAYVEELVTFPASKNDDRVDATSQALNWMSDRKTRKRRQREMQGLV